jgi:ribosome assembly protein 4
MEAVPASKKAKRDEEDVSDIGSSDDEEQGGGRRDLSSMIVQFSSLQDEQLGPQIDIPLSSTPLQMEELVNTLMGREDASDRLPYTFYVQEQEVMDSLQASVDDLGISKELVLRIVYQPLAVFRVTPVSRCTDTMPGHSEAVLHVQFSPDGKRLASGGGDMTVRFWDMQTCTPKFTCRGHKHHVLCTAWSPDGKRFASADRKGELRLWDPANGAMLGQPLVGHKQWVTSLSWEPMHKNGACERLASGSKDSTIKVWNVRTGRCIITLSGHTDSVESIQWGGEGLLYSASRDRTIKVWNVDGGEDKRIGILVRTLVGHGHRVNTLALSSEHVLRTGPFGYKMSPFSTPEEGKKLAMERYADFKAGEPERLVSGSDDFTLFMWHPETAKHPVARLAGHQQPVNHISFSPDGRYFASASFDKKVKVWDGRTGKFIATLTGHVGAVYRVSWSGDSRMLVSASKDSTVKLWQVKDFKRAKETLPGHADEVYALDWSPLGQQVASGSKDRTIKVWR